VSEASTVTAGGHQLANIKITRAQPDQETSKMTLWEKTKALIGIERVEKAKSFSTLRAEGDMKEDLWKLKCVLSESFESILEQTQGMQQRNLLQQSLAEFTIAVQELFPKKEMDTILEVDFMRTLKTTAASLDESTTDLLSPNALIEIDRLIQTLATKATKSEENMTIENKDESSALEEIKRARDEQVELVRTLTAENEAMKKEKEEVELSRSADGLEGFGKSKEQVVSIYRQLDEDGRTLFAEMIRAAKAQEKEGDVTVEIGRNAAKDSEKATPSIEINRIAKDIQEKTGVTLEKAKVQAYAENPILTNQIFTGE